jgi:hypothetical protein
MILPTGTQIYHNAARGAGSLGGFFTFGDNDIFALSNNHVIADANNCRVGDPIYKSGSKIQIGTVYCWITLDPKNMNYIDIALAKLDSSMQPLWRMPQGVVQPAGFAEAADGTPVYMVLSDRRINTGIVSRQSIDFPIEFNFGNIIFPFTSLIEIRSIDGGSFSVPGDSGSIIFDNSHNVIGVLIGTSADTTKSYAIPFINGDTGIKSVYDLEIWQPAT